MIETFIIEEHNEAFSVWQYARLNNIISSEANILLHVDEHADMEIPHLEENLSIDDFIIPCIYQGVFNQVYWLRRNHRKKGEDGTFYLASVKDEAKCFYRFEKRLKAMMLDPDYKSCKYGHITPDMNGLNLDENCSLVLDIDLDYFFSDEQNARTFKIQITEREYQTYVSNPYHKMRLMGGRVKAIEEDGGYYYVNQIKLRQQNSKFDAQEVSRNMDQFILFLQKNKIQPCLINICRSRFSGYTPSEHWQWIEDKLLQELEKIFSLKIELSH